MSADERCSDHSGCLSDIKTLRQSDRDQWRTINSMNTRINIVLGGVALSCLMLAADLIVRGAGG